MLLVGSPTLDRSKVITETKRDIMLFQVRVLGREANNLASVKQRNR